MKIQEPSVDLAVADSLISSIVSLLLPTSLIICSEVALLGKIRHIPYADLKLKKQKKIRISKSNYASKWQLLFPRYRNN
ncbi:DNA repair radA domain protein [Wolbachia endosymbiont of Wuchereria bancrofti]|nr:DNA repair radA domain protein [Wolbachia endosymbiont of Wuchereria bancrofti]